MFTLPSLPYSYDALLPYIDEKTMRIHHTKHHQGYVNRLNKALEQVKDASTTLSALLSSITTYGMAVRNNAGGHYNHTLFWESMLPGGADKPEKDLAKAITRDFGSFSTCIEHFSKQAISLFGSGWTWLCTDKAGVMHIINTPNQDNPLMYSEKEAAIPILGLDVWEHAYYLHYQHDRAAYVKAFWNLVNWSVVAARYDKVLSS